MTSRTIRIVGVSGSLTVPSRTTSLVAEVAYEIAEPLGASVEIIELGSLVESLAATSRDALGADAVAALEAVEVADLVVVGSPAYRATYAGIFKHFFDFVGQYSLVDTPIVLTGTGGSERHALLVEHQMRPLFGFFQAISLPIGIYGTESDFENYVITSPDLRERISRSSRQARAFLQSRTSDGVDRVERSLHSSHF